MIVLSLRYSSVLPVHGIHTITRSQSSQRIPPVSVPSVGVPSLAHAQPTGAQGKRGSEREKGRELSLSLSSFVKLCGDEDEYEDERQSERERESTSKQRLIISISLS